MDLFSSAQDEVVASQAVNLDKERACISDDWPILQGG